MPQGPGKLGVEIVACRRVESNQIGVLRIVEEG